MIGYSDKYDMIIIIITHKNNATYIDKVKIALRRVLCSNRLVVNDCSVI